MKPKKKTTAQLKKEWHRFIESEIKPILLKSNGNKPRKGVVLICSICDQPFYRRPSRKNKYCSKECESKSKLGNKPLKCIVCKNLFYCSKSQELLRNRKTCSKICRGKHQSIRQRGSNNPSWQGGKSGERSIRYWKKSEDWRKEVFKRDSYTCQKCKKKGGYLEAHHIKPFAYFPKLRFELSNGLTLCRKCHDKTKLSAKAMRQMYGKRI